MPAEKPKTMPFCAYHCHAHKCCGSPYIKQTIVVPLVPRDSLNIIFWNEICFLTFGAVNVFSGTIYFHTLNIFNIEDFYFNSEFIFNPPPLLGTFICQLLGV